MIVVDASLVAKWLLPEADSDIALSFMDRHLGQFAAPDLLAGEVAGAIVRRANMRVMTKERAASLLGQWFDSWDDGFFVSYRITGELLRNAGELALDLGHPLPDCIYLALAMQLGCTLATCDAKFRDKAVALHVDVKLLADFDL